MCVRAIAALASAAAFYAIGFTVGDRHDVAAFALMAVVCPVVYVGVAHALLKGRR